jgi:hypothetical protein
MKISNLGALVLTTSLVAAQQAHAFGPRMAIESLD